MKKLLLLLVLLSTKIFSQFPITEEFNAATTWSYTNGAGMQNYGGAENYATFNVGLTPYPNGSTITITSPTYTQIASCSSSITVSFPLSGIIENGWDFMDFQYWNGASWITQQTFTGVQSSTYSYNLSNTINRFRFRLRTDATVNTYNTFPPPKTNVYYYDIARFTINCTTVLPIELVEFLVKQEDCINKIQWSTISEINNDHFELERSSDAINFVVINKMSGSSNSTNMIRYLYYDKEPLDGINYYRLKQYDIDGKNSCTNIISIDNSCSREKYQKVVNLLGQEVTEDYKGTKLYIYNNRIIKRTE